jgi:PHP family Zn ribbon phosphoesterase
MYSYDGHGHSTASDGLHEPEKIIDVAVSKGLNIIGLSDHNIVSKLPRFLDYADKINQHGMKILPIPGVEISTTKGHLLITIPDRKNADEFIHNFKKPSKRPQPLEIIEEYIHQYDAIVIFVHPELLLHGLKVDYIEELIGKIPHGLHKNLGIEVYNWMSQAVFWSRSKEERQIHKRNHLLNLATFSFTDYHSAYNVGNGSTALYMRDLSSEEFSKAIKERRTAPLNISSRGAKEYFEIAKTTLAAEVYGRTNKHNFHIPKT